MEVLAEQAEMFELMKQEMITKSTISYKANGTYSQIDMMHGQLVTKIGTYSVEGDQLTSTSDNGATNRVKIIVCDQQRSFIFCRRMWKYNDIVLRL